MHLVSKYRLDIQALRGIAVLAVVLFHANDKYFTNGYLGVDVFFVISGFVVSPLILRIYTSNSNNRLNGLLLFYRKRIYRLAPALASTLILSALIIFITLNPSDHERFAKQGVATLLLLGNIGAYKFSGNYFSGNPNLLVHTWSLSVEEQIYLILPLVLFFVFYKRIFSKNRIILLYLFTTLVSLVLYVFPQILQIIYSKMGIQIASQIAFYSPICRIWQFTLGGLAYLFISRFNYKRYRFTNISHLLLSLVLVIILFSPSRFFLTSTVQSIILSIFVFLILILNCFESLPLFLSKILVWFGDRSYSIYLLHWPLIYMAKYSQLLEIRNENSRTLQVTVALIITMVLGSASYSIIENKFRLNSMNNRSHSTSFLKILLATFIIPLSGFLLLYGGAKQQYWGLDKNISTPAFASFLDSKCSRDSESGPPCIYAKSKTEKTALLIGDSHAGALSQAFIDAANESNWNAVVWTHSGCQIQFQKSSIASMTNSCINVNLQMKDWVVKNNPNLIVISQFIRDTSNQDELRAAISELKSLGPNILLIENNPIFPDGKDFMVSRPIFMKPYIPPKSYLQSSMDIKDSRASNDLARWASDNGIETVNLEPLFCKFGRCNRYSQKGWLYIDRDHLSVEGANLTIPQLLKYFTGL